MRPRRRPLYGIEEDPVKIGELAKKTGCQVVTIRYYEKEGLLPRAERSDGNYRLYGDADEDRLRFILHCRHHGMKLADIRRLLVFQDTPQADCSWVRRMIENHIDNIDRQIASLRHLRAHLEKLRHKCPPDDRHGGCGIISSLHQAANCPFCEDANCPVSATPCACGRTGDDD